ncbi:MAG: cytidine deaminase [Clostridiales bacterium]|nr:cytidine deaminase [Clostridiales bacterium]
MDKKIDGKKLLSEAKEARKNGYAPFSSFTVGAALLTKDGKIYRGCNIESSVMSPSLCAERVALAKAISEGEKEFTAIAIAGAPSGEDPKDPCYPCGVCRQVLSEHADLNTFQIITEENGKPVSCTLSDLLPKAFIFQT